MAAKTILVALAALLIPTTTNQPTQGRGAASQATVSSSTRANGPTTSRRTEAERVAFDLVEIRDATFGWITPSIGTERLERGVDLAYSAGYEDQNIVRYVVEGDRDYTATAVFRYPDGTQEETVFDLTRSRIHRLDFAMYHRLSWARRLAQVVEDYDITDAELADSMARMSARLDTEGIPSDE
jgi:hypothetical protein